MKKTKIIGLVGPTASGKEEVKKYICKKYNAKSYKFSTVLRDILTRIHIPISKENMQNLSLDLRTRFGEDILAKVIKEDSKQEDCDFIIIDGVRRVKDIKYFLASPEFKLISIDADMKIRYERMLKRNENEGDDKKSFSQFELECNKEAEKEIPEVMKIADYNINNDKDFNHLHQQIDEIISKINS